MATAYTILSPSPIDLQLLKEISRSAIGAGEVLERGAALANRALQYRLDLGHQPFALFQAQGGGTTARINAGGKQRLVGVDVAHADHQLVIHQPGLDGAGLTPTPLIEVVAI